MICSRAVRSSFPYVCLSRPFCRVHLSCLQRCSLWVEWSELNTKMLSRYTKIKGKPAKTLSSIIHWKVEPALRKQQGILTNSKSQKGVMMTVLGMSFGDISTCLEQSHCSGVASGSHHMATKIHSASAPYKGWRTKVNCSAELSPPPQSSRTRPSRWHTSGDPGRRQAGIEIGRQRVLTWWWTSYLTGPGEKPRPTISGNSAIIS